MTTQKHLPGLEALPHEIGALPQDARTIHFLGSATALLEDVKYVQKVARTRVGIGGLADMLGRLSQQCEDLGNLAVEIARLADEDGDAA